MAQTQTQEQTKQRDIRATVIRTAEGQAGGLRLDFANGKVLQLTGAQLSNDIMAEAIIHGLKQKLVDAAAISRNPETGRSATIEDKFAAVKRVYDRLLSGEWNEPREGGGGGSLLFKALCRMQPKKDAADIREWLDKRTDAEKAALRKNPKVAAIIVEIQAESAKGGEGVDSDALLEELQ